jgi:hypothetical protein
MGNANLNKETPLNNRDNLIIQNEEQEKKVGKSVINTILGKLEIFERKEIHININNPLNNISLNLKILNTEIIDDILHDYYPNYNQDLIATLNGHILSKELSLKDNNVQDNDIIYISNPLNLYLSFSDDNKFLITASMYQIFFNVFQRFISKECPKIYKHRLSECYYNGIIIDSFDIIANIGIKENDKILVVVGIDDNTKCLYNKGLEALKRFNFVYLNQKENKISINDIKIELNNKTFDEEELRNFSIIPFINLKILSLMDCQITNLQFLNSVPLFNLQEINLKNNKISFFVDLNLPQLVIFDLSYNDLSGNMLRKNNKNKIILSKFNLESLKELHLNNNEIENIYVFNIVSCGKLRKLNLSNNKINNLNILAELSFCNNIEDINLMNNEINNLNILRNVSLPKLKNFNLLNNDITDYSVFRLIFFPKLENLYAFPNQLDPDDYDKDSEIYKNFVSFCDNITEKGVEIKYKL